MRLATLQLETTHWKCIRMEIIIFKIFIMDVYCGIYVPKSSFMAPLKHRRKSKILNTYPVIISLNFLLYLPALPYKRSH